MRIISLVPSITETLFDFGLSESEIVGRTKFCIHPKEKVNLIPIVGGTKNIHIEKIQSLEPDLIIANKEENVKEQIEELMLSHQVWLTEIDTLEDNQKFIEELGRRLNKKKTAEFWQNKIETALDIAPTKSNITYTYLIWKNPYMTIGQDTFIHHMLSKLGLVNTHQHLKRYPEISWQDMESSDVILLSTEPFPFQEKHIEELRIHFPNKKILIVDGEAFSWYGSHIAQCKQQYLSLLNQLNN